MAAACRMGLCYCAQLYVSGLVEVGVNNRQADESIILSNVSRMN